MKLDPDSSLSADIFQPPARCVIPSKNQHQQSPCTKCARHSTYSNPLSNRVLKYSPTHIKDVVVALQSQCLTQFREFWHGVPLSRASLVYVLCVSSILSLTAISLSLCLFCLSLSLFSASLCVSLSCCCVSHSLSLLGSSLCESDDLSLPLSLSTHTLLCNHTETISLYRNSRSF